jgi:hypothetical protein
MTEVKDAPVAAVEKKEEPEAVKVNLFGLNV